MCEKHLNLSVRALVVCTRVNTTTWLLPSPS